MVSLSFKPLEERITQLSDLIGYNHLYSYEFMNMCLSSKTNDDLIEYIYLQSYTNENILKKDIGYIDAEKYILREFNNTREIRNTINDNLWDLFKIAMKHDKSFLVKLILNDERFELIDNNCHTQIFDFLIDKEEPSDILDVLFLSNRLSKKSKTDYIEELFKENKFPILKYIIDKKELFNKENVIINKTIITKFVSRATYYDNIQAFSYLFENEKIFKLINIDKVTNWAIINNDSSKCFTYLVEKELIDLSNNYATYTVLCAKTHSFQILTKILSYKYVSGNIIFDILKPHMNSENINGIIDVFILSGKVDIYQDDYYLFCKFAKDLYKDTLKNILQNTVFKVDEASKNIIRKKIFRTDPNDEGLIYDYIANEGFDDRDCVAAEAIMASKTDYIDKLFLLYPEYKFPDDIYYLQILSESKLNTIIYCIDKSLFNVKKWSHYIIIKLLEKNRDSDSLIVMKHKKTTMTDETISYINKHINKSRNYTEDFIKEVKIAIRMKKLADIIS